ncbi:MAG TPA: NUDIX domain-containing protein [Candidatus Nanopelagicales bacterium]
MDVSDPDGSDRDRSDLASHLTMDGRLVVVAAAVVRSGRLLGARRRGPSQLAGLWELPGGKVEPGEDPREALLRELTEELSIDAAVVGTVRGPGTGDWPLTDESVLRVLRVRLPPDEAVRPGPAHDQVRWFDPWQLGEVPWLPADVAPAQAAAEGVGTWVGFPTGEVSGTGTVIRVQELGQQFGIVVDRTPFHPLDHGWPDQPADEGTLAGQPVKDVLTGAIADDGVLLVGSDIDVRRGDSSRSWVVVHVVAGPAPEPGEEVALQVDAQHRERLSAAHTACHLAALAMNEVTADCWHKDPPRRDSRGNPDLDQSSIQVSRILPDEAHDEYRFGRSLRKAGFDAAGLRLAAYRDRAQSLLDTWVATGAAVRVETGGDPTLTARRRWVCDLPGRPGVIPCGGTHVTSLTQLAGVRLAWEPMADGLLVRTSLGR